ncbi:hypothetical protein SSX86_012776 [Deinandra increscens subsp. villosa]|uniref:Non-reducing end beta-L-arabinofuranosidase-like GH127 catalytic domain-containing protein n=1 Tax=Deinandra increscens subsp. villosa TaxID=3103831 RepID=A0AAP0D6H1_9ASTR
MHKIMAGLVDQYVFAGNTQALKVVTKMADYFCKRVQNVSMQYTIERDWQSSNEESGGMNDVMYQLYTITGDTKHLLLANLFDKPCFLGPLALKADELSGFHSNTHIPIVVGSQMRKLGCFSWMRFNSSHMYANATRGTSVSEFWTDPKRVAITLQMENEESMNHVSRILFRWTKEMGYADYYDEWRIGYSERKRTRDYDIHVAIRPGYVESFRNSYLGNTL